MDNNKKNKSSDYSALIDEDTIVAISTGLSPAGIGIVRMSGPAAFDTADEVFKPISKKKFTRKDNRRLRYGTICDNEKVIDEVLVSYMLGPHTYTGENIVEINCHGGPLSLKRILNLVIEKGIRIAGPGEFTRRAFLNGRIDLAQAEAVGDIINATSTRAQDQALKQLSGDLSGKIGLLKKEMLNILASVEYSINFTEDAMEEPSVEPVIDKAEEVLDNMNRMLEASKSGRIIREGISTVIVGKPNVGKSSLLNALIEDERAIVTDIPGTTRDSIEEVLNVDGITLRLIDTAGIRDTLDPVELVGVKRAKSLLKGADLSFILIDASRAIDSEDLEIIEKAKELNNIIIINKSDLNKDDSVIAFIEDLKSKKANYVEISAKNAEGLDDLKEMIKKLFFSEDSLKSSTDLAIMTNVRHINLLKKAINSLSDAIKGLRSGIPNELVDVDLQIVYENLAEITGESVEDDVLDRIFSSFCVGK